MPHDDAEEMDSHGRWTRAEDFNDEEEEDEDELPTRKSVGISMVKGRINPKALQELKDEINLLTTEEKESVKQVEIEEELAPVIEYIKKKKYSRGKPIEIPSRVEEFVEKSGKPLDEIEQVDWDSGLKESASSSDESSESASSSDESGESASSSDESGESAGSSDEDIIISQWGEESSSASIRSGKIGFFQTIMNNIADAINWDDAESDISELIGKRTLPRRTSHARRSDGKMDSKRDHKTKSKRFVFAEESMLWPDATIPYKFTDEITEEKRKEYRRAMDKYEYWSCFVFAEWNETMSSSLGHGNFLKYIVGNGCYAVPGNTYGAGQVISACCQDVAIHELGHALGAFHEQTSALRDQHIRVNYDNFLSNAGRLFYKADPKLGKLSDYYDLQSTMHYRKWGNSKNKRDVYTVLDEEMDYLALKPERTHYYLFEKLQSVYNCQAKRCADFDITCENDGYFSYIRKQCTCRCPEGLDPSTGCTTPYIVGDGLAQWPRGSFSFLKVDGQDCPARFEYGWVKHWSQGDVRTSMPYHTTKDIHPTQYHIVHEFCTRTVESAEDPTNVAWEKGSYCILKKDNCPYGFEEGTVKIYDKIVEDRANVSFGELPDVMLGADMLLSFCCRNDGDIEDPIKLPTKEPFFLFQEAERGCQEVIDTIVEYEYFNIKNRMKDSSQLIGHTPIITTRGLRFTFSLCYYAPIKENCAHVIELTDETPSVEISSPNHPGTYGNYQKCSWFVKSPANSKIILNFHDFDFESVDGSCRDTLQIRNNLPGQVGQFYCGKGFDKTIVSGGRYLVLVMKTDYAGAGRGFRATVTMQKLDVDNLCYKYEDGGLTYRGTRNFTRHFRTCLPWSQVTKCPHHPFNDRDFSDGLEGNYCRNPGSGYAPWCYYNAELCLRDYCDVCDLVRCYDLFGDCSESLTKDPAYCEKNEDGEALRGCAHTCGRCVDQPGTPVVSEVKCSPPLCMPFTEELGTPKLQYDVGETVTYKCAHGPEKNERQCLSNGKWSGGTYTCGVCPREFTYRDGYCYKWFDEFVTKLKADKECSKYNAVVAHAKTEEDTAFLTSLAMEERSFWISLNDTATEGSFVWEDGTDLGWSNWQTDQPNDFGDDQDCVVVTYKKREWDDVNCEAGDFHSFICTLKLSDNSMCTDWSPDCAQLISEVPDSCTQFPGFVREMCPASCSQCGDGDITCVKPENPANAEESPMANTVILPGQYFTYQCNAGYSLAEGSPIRTCLITGDLSGTPPMCLPDNEVETPNNDFDIRPRGYLLPAWITVTSDSGALTIHKEGVITKWTMYSNYNTSLWLQVYRPQSDNQFLLVGQNFVESTKDDRITTIKILEADRIAVQPGDLIGFHLGASSGGIAYDMHSFCECLHQQPPPHVIDEKSEMSNAKLTWIK
ncbi:hypothetical protein ScPMuIL_003377 [Solemya velum]